MGFMYDAVVRIEPGYEDHDVYFAFQAPPDW